jgi:hypothetical protein
MNLANFDPFSSSSLLATESLKNHFFGGKFEFLISLFGETSPREKKAVTRERQKSTSTAVFGGNALLTACPFWRSH